MAAIRDEENQAKLVKVSAVKEKIRLQKKGFPRDSDIGFTFPGINPNKIKERVELSKKKALESAKSSANEASSQAEPDLPEPPKMKIGAIATNGTIAVSFNQDMFAPDAINQRVYQKVFRFGMESDVDGSL